jgi:hypothetical protein
MKFKKGEYYAYGYGPKEWIIVQAVEDSVPVGSLSREQRADCITIAYGPRGKNLHSRQFIGSWFSRDYPLSGISKPKHLVNFGTPLYNAIYDIDFLDKVDPKDPLLDSVCPV